MFLSYSYLIKKIYGMKFFFIEISIIISTVLFHPSLYVEVVLGRKNTFSFFVFRLLCLLLFGQKENSSFNEIGLTMVYAQQESNWKSVSAPWNVCQENCPNPILNENVIHIKES